MPENLRNNIERLMAAYESAKAENLSLKKELEQRELRIAGLNGKIKELSDEVAGLQLKTAFTTTSKDNADARARIDGLIKEIDKCIALLED